MEKDFIEFLDHVYEPGYGWEFKENNPSAFYQQLERFNQLPKIPKYETILIFQTTQWDDKSDSFITIEKQIIYR
ncbi:hypothetical protein ABDJ41_20330 [Pedobacter sp. ASV1-7]|uniref:hypothetical protein n=1 Tax=Pedobacter sp. ASV1-7 TaxID=3145237 RepID=UPI0032E92E9E